MAKMDVLVATTSYTEYVMIYRSDTGAPLTGLAYNSPNLVAYYVLPRAAAVSITLATLTVTGAYSSGGFVEVSASNFPGLYRFDIPNAALASGRATRIILKGADNMAPCAIELQLTAWNNQDAVRGGMTALPNAAAAASGGLIINGANTGTVTLAALTCTGTFTISNGLTITRSTSNTSAITATGNGTGHGAIFTSGSGATGNGISAVSASTNGHGVFADGNGTGSGVNLVAGATGNGIAVAGGATSGDAIAVTTTSGHGMIVTATGAGKNALRLLGGNAVTTTAAGSAIYAQGGTATTSGGGTAAQGVYIIGGSGAASTNGAAEGIYTTGGGTTTVSGSHGAVFAGTGVGYGLIAIGGDTGVGAAFVGGTTSGDALVAMALGGGNGIVATATGTSKHGIISSGSSAGTGDGIKAVAGAGGVDIRGNITGNLVGTVSTLTTYTGNTPQTGDSFARLGLPTGVSVSADIDSVYNQVVGLGPTLTGLLGTPVVSVSADIASLTTDVGNLNDFDHTSDAVIVGTINSSATNIKKNANLNDFPFVMTDSTTNLPATGLTITSQVMIDGSGSFTSTTNSATEIGSGVYVIDLDADDLNGNNITLMFTSAGAYPRIITLMTQP